MGSEESLTMISSSDDDFHYQTRQSSLSRLSICTNSFHDDEDEENCTNHPSDLGNYISKLSLDSIDDDDGAEADGEISVNGEESDSDYESAGFYSPPTIITRRRKKLTNSTGSETGLVTRGNNCNLVKQRRVLREKSKREGNQYGHGFNGVVDSDGDGNRYGGVGGGGGELTVKVGKKSMMMDFEEVKACRELGFDLDVPGWVSVSNGSNRETQTSSGCNSPIANWRISSPGDEPKEVKARLKMWAQAVALASASR